MLLVKLSGSATTIVAVSKHKCESRMISVYVPPLSALSVLTIASDELLDVVQVMLLAGPVVYHKYVPAPPLTVAVIVCK